MRVSLFPQGGCRSNTQAGDRVRELQSKRPAQLVLSLVEEVEEALLSRALAGGCDLAEARRQLVPKYGEHTYFEGVRAALGPCMLMIAEKGKPVVLPEGCRRRIAGLSRIPTGHSEQANPPPGHRTRIRMGG